MVKQRRIIIGGLGALAAIGLSVRGGPGPDEPTPPTGPGPGDGGNGGDGLPPAKELSISMGNSMARFEVPSGALLLGARFGPNDFALKSQSEWYADCGTRLGWLSVDSCPPIKTDSGRLRRDLVAQVDVMVGETFTEQLPGPEVQFKVLMAGDDSPNFVFGEEVTSRIKFDPVIVAPDGRLFVGGRSIDRPSLKAPLPTSQRTSEQHVTAELQSGTYEFELIVQPTIERQHGMLETVDAFYVVGGRFRVDNVRML